ncbi:MLO-like protein 9 [Aristolochia californica]|uniref:MLO-like protein 9 n=1 Tax=Aristolochia californica TaxID=171875 RepID=UPI0035D7E1CC
MGGGGGEASERKLDQTPTWAVASVCAIIVVISIFLEKLLHRMGEWFTRRRKKALFEALEKVKAELMVLGFISLLLTFGQSYIARVCIKEKTANTMLPCSLRAVEGIEPHTNADTHAPVDPHADHGHGDPEEHAPVDPHTDSGHGDQEHTTVDPHAKAGRGDHEEPASDDPHAEHGKNGDHKEPASDDPHAEHGKNGDHGEHGEGGHRRRILWAQILAESSLQRRKLSGGESRSKCPEGQVSLVSVEGLHQLHIFIFFLAVFHVAYSALTMTLGRLKIRAWKEWERETSSLDYEFSNDPARFRFAHETSFVRAHTSLWNRVAFSFYFVSFFRQFFRSVRKADYTTMRNGFINVHLAPGSKFDFQKYIKRSLEDDFKVVVEISPVLWFSAVLFLLLNVDGWQALFWISIVPLVIILAVGTKLQAIITRMALEIKERHAVVQGIPLVQLGDKHFWFGRPKLVLFLIHFTLFQNAFQIIYFLWIWYEFGLKSCFHRNFQLILVRVVLGVFVQFVCSYTTLPLYALVSQMGSHMKKSIFDDHTSKAINKWRMGAKKKTGARSPPRTLGKSPSMSPTGSPVTRLQRFKSAGHVGGGSNTSPRKSYSDQDVSDMDSEKTSSRATLIANVEMEGMSAAEDNNEREFTFSKPSSSRGRSLL